MKKIILKFLINVLNLMSCTGLFKKSRTETRENVYLITMISREPRQIVEFDVAFDKRNVLDKKDTHNVESINADLRYYIPVLARTSRCFARKIETLYAVVDVFVDVYNHFGLAKYKYRQHKKTVSFLSLSFISFNYAISHFFFRDVIDAVIVPCFISLSNKIESTFVKGIRTFSKHIDTFMKKIK